MIESDVCTDGLSTPAVMVFRSAVLKERYSCIMYRGYLLWRFIERFLNAKLASTPA